MFYGKAERLYPWAVNSVVEYLPALDIIAHFGVEQVVILSLMGLPGTPVQRANPPRPEEVAELIATARLRMPHTPISLGCARTRGNDRLDVLAVDAGVNRMALPSDEAIARAQAYGLDIRYQKSCCSVPGDRARCIRQ